MEDLNDVEFGSDKSAEEAPILIAQRFLNIFRQVHIFNKAKRDQFDDELLALPQNIVDLIKGMPGGRLLIEHVEDVKTERGIAFVKSKKEDFITEDVPSSSTSQVSMVQGGVGSVVMDASFAETLAKSMAEAFKPLSGGSAPLSNIPTDFGKAFELIAQEIRSSRASLLDVLKETRSITDSVIASQISISKVLENLMAAQNKERIDSAVLSDKIIASQAAITKMLEKMQTSSYVFNNTGVNYSDIGNKSQDLRSEIKSSVNTSPSPKEATLQNRLQNVINSEFDTSVSGESPLQEESFEASIPSFVDNGTNNVLTPREHNGEISGVENKDFISEDRKKKKKKKKKKNNPEQGFGSATSVSEDVSDSSFEELPSLSNKQNENLSVTKSFENVSEVTTANVSKNVASFGGVIRNGAYNHQDDFSNIKLDDAFLDGDNFSESLSEKQTKSEIKESDLSAFNDLNSLDDFSFASPVDFDDNLQTSNDTSNFDTGNISATNSLKPDSETNSHKQDADDLDSLINSDGLDFSLPAQEEAPVEEDNRIVESGTDGLDSLINSDGLDFSLPAQEETPVEEDNRIVESGTGGLDSFINSDGLNFSLPEQGETPVEEDNRIVESGTDGLDSLINSDGLDFSLPEQEEAPVEEDNRIVESGTDGLDSLINSDGLDFSLPEQEEAPVEEEIEVNRINESKITTTLDDFAIGGEQDIVQQESDNALDSFISDNEEAYPDDFENTEPSSVDIEISETTPAPALSVSSRYSAELERIRAALTSDNVDISSLDTPIALDEYSDDENLVEDSTSPYDEIASNQTSSKTGSTDDENKTSDSGTYDDDEWEWEYVDENGNEISAVGDEDQDWEWEYVEDDEAQDETDNNRQ